MDRSQIPPLRSLTIRARPLTSHAISWSSDAELAVATDETIYVFIPEFPKASTGGADGTSDKSRSPLSSSQYALEFQATGLFRPFRVINAQLCAFAGIKLPPVDALDEEGEEEVEEGAWRDKPGRDVTAKGGTLSHVVRAAWSPPGMGPNLRPVLTSLSTAGNLVTLAEHSEPSTLEGSTTKRTRDPKSWRILWGLGGGLPLPAEDHVGAYRTMDERITAFDWAEKIDVGRGLLAYATDEEEVVIMSVLQFPRRSDDGAMGQFVCKVQEVARFDASGPHKDTEESNTDFVPHRSAFSIKWSPWLHAHGSRIALLSYIGKNYVGFRRVTLSEEWALEEQPNLKLEASDSSSTCLFLSTDAFVEWESRIWTQGDSATVRGLIASPFDITPFEVSLSCPPPLPVQPHSVSACSTTYPSTSITNPITGLVIHRLTGPSKPRVPLFTAVRTSATATNNTWYQTNLPETSPYPQWATRISAATARTISRSRALDGLESDTDSDEYGNGGGGDDVPVEEEGESKIMVSPERYTLMGLAQSPGNGCTAVLAARHSTTHPLRRAVFKVLFGRGAGVDSSEMPEGLTAEGRTWEEMYGGMDPGQSRREATNSGTGHLHELFTPAAGQQTCVFCDGDLASDGFEATCLNGHVFAICTSSGLAILAPGISRVCGVCGLRSLTDRKLNQAAQDMLGTSVSAFSDVCGSCGGKFIA